MGCCEIVPPFLGSSGGGGGGGGKPGEGTVFSYTVSGAEPDLSELVIPLPAVRGSTAYVVFPSQGDAALQVGMSVSAVSKTVNDFVLSLSINATAGDVFNFYVADPY